MIQTIEKSFVRTFIIETRQSRMQYVLGTVDKRMLYIHKMTVQYFKREVIHACPKEVNTEQKLECYLKGLTGESDAYVFSTDEYDGSMVKLSTAVREQFGLGPYILFFPKQMIAFFEAEEERGHQDRAILIANSTHSV